MSGRGRNRSRFAGVGFFPEALTLFAAMSVQPSGSRKILINNFIASLKSAGVWSKLDVLWLPAAHDAQAGTLNWKSPSTFTLTAVSAPTFTTDRGYAGNGSSSYLNTGFIPSSNGVNLTQDSASIGFYVNATSSDVASAAVINFGSQDASQGTYCVAWRAAAGAGGKMNDNTAGTVGTGIATRLGMTVFDRSASNLRTIYRNGASTGTAAITSVGRSTVAMYAGAFNNTGAASGFITDRHAALFAGSQLSAAEHSALYTAILTYLTAIGAN